jgi:hypothetical protein
MHCIWCLDGKTDQVLTSQLQQALRLTTHWELLLCLQGGHHLQTAAMKQCSVKDSNKQEHQYETWAGHALGASLVLTKGGNQAIQCDQERQTENNGTKQALRLLRSSCVCGGELGDTTMGDIETRTGHGEATVDTCICPDGSTLAAAAALLLGITHTREPGWQALYTSCESPANASFTW